MNRSRINTLGFTLPEIMLCLLVLSVSLPAATHLLTHASEFSRRVNHAYAEDAALQLWLVSLQLAAGAQTAAGSGQSAAGAQTAAGAGHSAAGGWQAEGELADGRSWRIENQGAINYWWVAASNHSPEEFGWYMAE